MKIFTIAGRELRSLFLSPLAWTLLAIVQILLAYLFLSQLDTYLISIQPKLSTLNTVPGITSLIAAPLYGNTAVILLLITPLLTMRLISEERRNKTLPLLFSSPVSMAEIVLGKFCGIFVFLLILEGMVTLMPLSLLAGTELDSGKLAACVLSLALLMGSYAALGLYMSSLTQHPAVAGLLSFGVALLLWILDWAVNESGGSGSVLAYISTTGHFNRIASGLVNTKDVLYYLLFIVTFLVLSTRQLDSVRLQR